MDKRIIAVCGATGNVGSAVVESLVSKLHWNVTALTRDPDGAKALGLRGKCVRIVKADHLDKESMLRAFKGAYGVFGITQPFSSDYKSIDSKGEYEQGRNIVDSCFENGVEHLVLSTVFGNGNAIHEAMHLASKAQIVKYLKNTSVPYTIVKPASFMDNIGKNYFPVKHGYVKGFTDRDVKVPYISTNDIGEFVAKIFEKPEIYLKNEINLMADLVSGDDIAKILSKIRKGQPFRYKSTPRLLMWLFAREFYKMRLSFEKAGRPPYPREYIYALQICKEMHPELLTMERYLLSQGYDAKQL